MSLLVGLMLTFVGGIMFVRLTWTHFGSTGLWFLAAYVLLDIGGSLIKRFDEGER